MPYVVERVPLGTGADCTTILARNMTRSEASAALVRCAAAQLAIVGNGQLVVRSGLALLRTSDGCYAYWIGPDDDSFDAPSELPRLLNDSEIDALYPRVEREVLGVG